MAILKSKEIAKMTARERDSKLKDLKMELVRANVAANKTNAKTKEIKRAISRLNTFMKSEKFNKSLKEDGLKKK
ncbi:MAG: hypothetical protein KJ600_04405 [Nanoarchaeota archaeon]|nr:hypothetical protein [Nanoarchaeota archaeon]MBU1103770.1 hypothetical protein [Nanoarchaeota archaeon]